MDPRSIVLKQKIFIKNLKFFKRAPTSCNMNRTPIWLQKLRCTLLPSSISMNTENLSLYENTYSLWKKIFTEVLLKVDQKLDINNLLRQDFLLVLHVDDQVIGMIASQVMNTATKLCWEHPYFSVFPEAKLKEISASGPTRFGTYEYLMSNPSVRKAFDGFSTMELLIGLLLEAHKSLGVEYAFGTSIVSSRSHNASEKLGFKHVGRVEKYNLDCVLSICDTANSNPHPLPAARNLIDKLWSEVDVQASSVLETLVTHQSRSTKRAA